MAHLRILIVLIFTVLGYITVIDSAAVSSEGFGEVLERTALAMRTENSRIQRDADTSNEKRSRICNHKEPCGWAVYIPFTGKVDYYMKNTCVCPDGISNCVRTYDDPSANAYVHLCRENTTAGNFEATGN